jgi:uncharacterized protein (DUF427 family)
MMGLSRTVSGEMLESGFADRPEHRIVVEPAGEMLKVTAGGRTVLETDAALIVREAHYSPVYYFPRGAIDPALLERTDHTTWCPFKGRAAYFSLHAGGGRLLENAVWSYEDPFERLAQIKDCIAFYPDKAAIEPVR